jgi:hypothetical protein
MTEVYQSPGPQQPDLESTAHYASDIESLSGSVAQKSPSDTNSFQSADETPQLSPVSNTLPVSRPLSRCSATSGLSVTATKDGVEGKRVKKSGIPGYPLNLINQMYANYANKNRNNGNAPHLTPNENNNAMDTADLADDGASVMSLSSMIPQYSKDDLIEETDKGYTYDTEKAEYLSDLDCNNDVKSTDESLEGNSDYKNFLRKSSGV